MGRRDYEYLRATCHKGINQQSDLADPRTECEDARNVWAPNGRIEQRPGYWTVTTLQNYTLDKSFCEIDSLIGATYILKEDPIGTFTDVSATGALGSLGVGKRVYIGFHATNYWDVVLGYDAGDAADRVPLYKRIVGMQIGIEGANTNNIYLTLEYARGVSATNEPLWTPLPYVELYDAPTGNFGLLQTKALGSASTDTMETGLSQGLRFAMPEDWTTTIADSASLLSAKWLRLTLYSVNGSTAFSAGTDIYNAAGNANIRPDLRMYWPGTSQQNSVAGMCVAQFGSTKRYLFMATTLLAADSTTRYYLNLGSLTAPASLYEVGLSSITTTAASNSLTLLESPASFAVIPQFNEAYAAFAYTTALYKAYPTEQTDQKATVETDPAFVGPGAYFDSTVVPQLGAWPACKYTTFFQGQLWAANLQDDPQGFRWSAPAPYYKVWPEINYEQLSENDNSSITGLYGYDQNLTIFKNDSIWRIVYTGAGPQNLGEYTPEPVVRGVGCVSNASIAEVRGRLVFLGEDGIYAYDGTPNIQKISDKIQSTLKTINSGARQYAVGVNWKSQSCYLLAFRSQTSFYNNTVVCWDYKNDSWWVWDNIPAVAWMLDEGSDDLDRLYFVDPYSRIFEFGIGNTDNGATISAYVKTHRLGVGDTATLRSIDISTNNLSRALTITASSNDEGSGGQTSGALDLTDAAEIEFGAGTYDVTSYTPDRRRNRRLMCRKRGETFQIKVAHSTHDTPWKLTSIEAGIQPPSGKR